MMYRIEKVLNHNTVMAIHQDDHKEVLIMGKGVAFGKKVGDFKKKESESLEITGLEIPRDYYYDKEELKVGHHLEGTGFYI